MKTHINFLSAVLLACMFIPLDSQASEGGIPARSVAEAKTGRAAPFGYAANAAPDRVITIVEGKTRSIHVKRLETVRIVDGSRSVTWTFDTLGVTPISLANILPNATNVTIYVEESPMYAH
ncbi:MAG: CzcE family metal-binding protein [Janthinobacterium lividum]|uniref:CzcE family metal-binding protein n=1 Tax=Massilia yuzhufengensis TaxID=1164594 RepID=UPI000B848FDE|nr:CzcE family metal-binding protein [Massilia yuzhufengensis]